MELLPESAQADDWFGPFLWDDEDAVERLRELGDRVVEVVPACVGMSLTLVDLGVTFTAAARDVRAAVLDGVQYVDDGPCVHAATEGEPHSWTDGDPEVAWRAFAQASAAAGIGSTLSLPIVRDGRAAGGFNLYASTADAFDGHHEALAQLLGAWADGATTNADLEFSTYRTAQEAPAVLRESTRLSVAVATVARVAGIDPAEAVARLQQAARRAGVPLTSLVDGIVGLLAPDRPAEGT